VTGQNLSAVGSQVRVSVFLILSRVGARVFERMLLVFVVFLLVDSAVAVFAGVLLPLGCGHRVPFRRVWD
jgi:hypothetical protein